MNNRSATITVLLAVALILGIASCSQPPEEINLTIEGQVLAAVKSTIESRPSATSAPTQTPYPTLTPLATYTPYPTFTPQATLAPLATYTPYPTMTPTPTNTATAVPTATSVAPVATALPSVAPANNLLQLKGEMANTLSDLSYYQSMLTQVIAGGGSVHYVPIDCQEIVATYDRIVSTIALNVSGDEVAIQNAYTVYQTATSQFAELAEAWTNGCRQAVANGETTVGIDDLQRGVLKQGIDSVKTKLALQLFNCSH